MSDPIDKAINGAANAVKMAIVAITISSTGRPFKVHFPADMTEAELFEVVGWMATAFRQGLAQQRQSPLQRAGLVLPRQ